jgi:hypothetical protein
MLRAPKSSFRRWHGANNTYYVSNGIIFKYKDVSNEISKI